MKRQAGGSAAEGDGEPAVLRRRLEAQEQAGAVRQASASLEPGAAAGLELFSAAAACAGRPKVEALQLRPRCVICHKVEVRWKKGGKRPWAFRDIPDDLHFVNCKRVYGVFPPKWCNACRLKYYKKTPLQILPITLLIGIAIPISADYTLEHAGFVTDPGQLLLHDAKYVQWLINGSRVYAAVEHVCCGAATMVLCMGCGCSTEQSALVKERAKNGEMVYIQPSMPFFVVQKLLTGGHAVRGKMEPCALVWVREESHLAKNFEVPQQLASRFKQDPRPLKGIEFMHQANLKTMPEGTVFEWAKASRFFKKQSTVGRYLFLAPSWDENGVQFGCRYVVPKGPEDHGCTIGTFSTPGHLE
jgi:hypothetical protein